MKRGLYILGSIFIFLALMSSVSAGLFDFLKPSGRASSQLQNVSVTIVGANAVTIGGISIPAQSPIELNAITVTFSVWVNDSDGVNDINTTSVTAEFKSGLTTKTSSCPFQNNINTKAANFSCSLSMSYWETPGTWNVRVQAKDFGNGTMMNGSSTFVYNSLSALVISPLTLTWPSLMTGAINQNSSNHPTIINNTGNFNGFVAITAYDLKGETSSSEAIPASSFSVGANGLQCTSGITLTNSSVRSTGISSNPGNLSLGGGAGQANIYYCIPLVPSVSSQIYSTKTFGSWTVTYQ